MKITLLSMMFLALSHVIYSQSLEETSNWIASNAGAPNQMFSNAVAYNAKTNKLLLYKNYSAPFKFRKVTEIDPAQVNSISLSETDRKSGLRGIVLSFKTGGSNTRIYLANNNTRVTKVNKIKEIQMYEFPILAEGSLEHAKKIKMAYINLFHQLGINVKDGDIL